MFISYLYTILLNAFNRLGIKYQKKKMGLVVLPLGSDFPLTISRTCLSMLKELTLCRSIPHLKGVLSHFFNLYQILGVERDFNKALTAIKIQNIDDKRDDFDKWESILPDGNDWMDKLFGDDIFSVFDEQPCAFYIELRFDTDKDCAAVDLKKEAGQLSNALWTEYLDDRRLAVKVKKAKQTIEFLCRSKQSQGVFYYELLSSVKDK